MKLRNVIATLLATAVVVTSGITVSANGGIDLNDIGGNTSASVSTDTESESESKSSGIDYGATNDAIRENISNNANVTNSDLEKAEKLAAPIVNIIRWAIAILLILFPVVLIFNSLVDFLCITLSPFRRAVLAVNGNGGASGGMGGMGMGMSGGAPASSGSDIFDTVAKWASDEAVASIIEGNAVSGSGGAMGGMGGMGMGMGMGGMGGMGGASAPVKKKSVLLSYLKKRLVALVIAGVCLICFACTAFTDLGLKLGSWLVERVGNISL